MHKYIKTWFTGDGIEKGQDLAEYALLIGLIALVVVVAGEARLPDHQVGGLLQSGKRAARTPDDGPRLARDGVGLGAPVQRVQLHAHARVQHGGQDAGGGSAEQI